MNLAPAAHEYLLALAVSAIRTGLEVVRPTPPKLDDCPAEVTIHRACFVTLTVGPVRLRGCCGTLEARRPLAAEVWHNALASAFADPRFDPLEAAELVDLHVSISVLGPLELVQASSEAQLLDAVVPGRDGLLLTWRQHRATFLPAVWESLPDRRDFLRELKCKAGLPAGFWAPDVVVHRYSTDTVKGFARDYPRG